MLRWPIHWLSPGGAAARLTILIYHRVLPRLDPMNPDEPDARAFESQMAWVRDWFNVLPLSEAASRLAQGTLPARALSITFDDGYADNREIAAPILQRLGLSATFFIATSFLGGGCMWNDRVIEALRACEKEAIDLTAVWLGVRRLDDAPRRRQVAIEALRAIKHLEPRQRSHAVESIVSAAGAPAAPPLMMSVDQLREMRELGMEIGAHTITHPILCRLNAQEAHHEIADGRRELEAILRSPVTLFAYPNGVPQKDYSLEHVHMVRELGFTAAVSTAWGAASRRSDRHQLPRFTPWDGTRWRYGARLMANLRRRELAAA